MYRVQLMFYRTFVYVFWKRLSNFVILKNKNVVARSIKDNTDFSIRELNELQESKIQNDISYSVFKPTEKVKIIAFNKIGGLIKPISLFSFIVSLAGILLFIVTFINTRFKLLRKSKKAFVCNSFFDSLYCIFLLND